MASSSKQERRVRAKEAKEKREESVTAAAELAANIKAEANSSADEHVTPSPHDTPPLSDFDDVKED